MSRLDDFIAGLCPDGVEWKTLGEVAEYRRGSFPQPYGESRWYGGENAMPFVQVADVAENMCLVKDTKQKISILAQPKSVFVPKGMVIVTLQGSIGRVAITQYDSYIDRTLAIFEKFKIEINKKYFAYQLERKFGFEKEYARGSTLKTITKEEFTKFQIPIPPLPVQQEIVRILDQFTAIEAELEVELEAELEARKKQYDYYRNVVLYNNDSNYKYEKIGDICSKTGNISWSGKGDTIFKYIDLTSVDRDTHTIGETSEINSDTAPSRAQRIVATNDIIFGTTRPTLKRFCIIPPEYNGQICSTGFCVLRADNAKVLSKFLYYQISKTEYYNYIETVQRGSAYPAVSDADVKRFEIPVPPIEEQEQIVAILDRFDALVNDITHDLPAEITARRKQFKYYRDKLLTFKEIGS